MSIKNKLLINTSPETEYREFNMALINAGADLIIFPTIKISKTSDAKLLNKKISELENYDGLIFTSSNSVKFFFERLSEKNIKYKGEIYSVGEKTKLIIEKYGYKVNFVPEKYSSDEIFKFLLSENNIHKKFLFPRGNISNAPFIGKLNNIDDVVIYDTLLPDENVNFEKVNGLLASDNIDCIIFISPSAISNFFSFFPNYLQKKSVTAVIGSKTKNKAEEFGLNVKIIPEKFTTDYLLSDIIKYFN